jgi:hypothetical protein
MPRALVCVLAVLLGACPSSEPVDDDDATLDEYTLEIVNDSANTFTLLQQRPCPSTDPSDYRELALPAGGLGPGVAWRWLLPTPGCFALALEGDGCFAEGQTDPLQLGDTFTWTVTDDDLLCQGG